MEDGEAGDKDDGEEKDAPIEFDLFFAGQLYSELIFLHQKIVERN